MSVVMLTKTPLQANMSYIQAGRDRFESGIPPDLSAALFGQTRRGHFTLRNPTTMGLLGARRQMFPCLLVQLLYCLGLP